RESSGATVLTRGTIQALLPSAALTASIASPAETNRRPASAAIGEVTFLAICQSSRPSLTERAVTCAPFSAMKTRSPSETGGTPGSPSRLFVQNVARGSWGGVGLSEAADRDAMHASRPVQSANALQDMVVQP